MKHNKISFNEIKGLFGQITLNRPEALNALSHDMIRAMDHQLAAWADAKHIKAVIVRSGNERAFCVGGDLREVYTKGRDAYPFFQDEYRLNARIFHYPKPYIALIDGLVMGGGAGISVHGSHRVVTEKTLFAMPETDIGFFPDIGASYFLSRCPGHTGIYLGLTGARINAGDMMELGLANYFVPSTLLNTDDILKIIEQSKALPPEPTLRNHRAEIDRCFSANTVEEILARLREQKTEWHHATIQSLLQKSPTSLKVTLQQLHRARELDLDACLNMEYNLALHFLENHDFHEGIRAMIIDKDRSPHWQPDTLELVTQNHINDYFLP